MRYTELISAAYSLAVAGGAHFLKSRSCLTYVQTGVCELRLPSLHSNLSGCLCGLGLQSSDKYCEMTSDNIYHLPLNVYVIVLGIGLFIFMLSMIFCCYLFRLRRQGTREQYGYNEVVLKGAGKKLSLLGQTCAVCLEEFRTRDELGVCPCSHAFHKKCLVKWLEIRSVCPMCNKPICRLQPDAPQGAEGPQDPEEV
ncbi:RING finger protein 122-like isoform X1 [Megalops cyprinoides]|uniref:RING finger protein 122-like isoform X1 n=2 Tax=Megalops cyprinoides TaxID=118141 RepID=UPI00186410E7|nr:RING finger protein 122-like isoform X1 [Megalops cyprinoides]